MKQKILIFLLLIVACREKNDDFKNEITKKNNFWVYFWQYPLNKDSISESPIYGTRFFDNGEIKIFSRGNGKENEIPNFENASSKKSHWKYIHNDSTFSFYGNEFKTIKLTKDTIVVLDKKTEKLGCFINKQ